MSDDQFAKLTKQLDERFAAIDGRFDKIDERFARIDERFDKMDERLNQHDGQVEELSDLVSKLYQHVDQRFDEMGHQVNSLDAKIDDTKAELKVNVDRVYNLVDEDLKRRETDEQERLASNHQLDRHDGWIKQLAAGTKTKLVPEP